MARWPEGRTIAGTRLEPSVRRMTRAERSPTPAIRPTSPSPSTTAEPSVTPSIRPTLTIAERRNGLPASAITSPVTKVMPRVQPDVVERQQPGVLLLELQRRLAPALHPLQLAAELGVLLVDPAVGAQVGDHPRGRGDRLHRPGEARHEAVDQADAELLDARVVDPPEQEERDAAPPRPTPTSTRRTPRR